MLDDEIVEAVQNKKFHIWAINKIEEGIILLTGKEAAKKRRDGSFTPGSVFDGVQKKIIQFDQDHQTVQEKRGEG